MASCLFRFANQSLLSYIGRVTVQCQLWHESQTAFEATIFRSSQTGCMILVDPNSIKFCSHSFRLFFSPWIACPIYLLETTLCFSTPNKGSQTDAFCISEKIGRARSLGNSCLVPWPLGGGKKRSNMPRKQNRKECRHRASSRRQGDKWRHCAKSQGPSSENNLWTSNYTRKLEKGHSVHWAQRMATLAHCVSSHIVLSPFRWWWQTIPILLLK